MLTVKVRLVSGSNPFEGRVEVQYNDEWGTICDHNWDLNDATVICRMLGRDRAVYAPTRTLYGKGCGEIFFHGLICSGTEKSLLECTHNGLKTNQVCGHDNDVSVICDTGNYTGILLCKTFTPYTLLR